MFRPTPSRFALCAIDLARRWLWTGAVQPSQPSGHLPPPPRPLFHPDARGRFRQSSWLTTRRNTGLSAEPEHADPHRRCIPLTIDVTIRRAISLVPIPCSPASSRSSAYSSSSNTRPDGVRDALARTPSDDRFHFPKKDVVQMSQTGDTGLGASSRKAASRD